MIVSFNTPCPESEISPRFLELMSCSMAVSFHKYGKIADAFPHKQDAIASLKKRLRLYQETGNTDYLVDVANFAMIEFIHPSIDGAEYRPTDGGEGRVWNNGQTNSFDNFGNRI